MVTYIYFSLYLLAHSCWQQHLSSETWYLPLSLLIAFITFQLATILIFKHAAICASLALHLNWLSLKQSQNITKQKSPQKLKSISLDLMKSTPLSNL